MKKVFSLLVVLSVFFAANAQFIKAPKTVQNFEVELGVVGLTGPLGGYKGLDPVYSIFIPHNLAVRYNFKGTPWDCGLLFQFDKANRMSMDENIVDYDTMMFGITGGYNFRQGEKVNPFANLALCVAKNEQSGFLGASDLNYTSFSVAPKIGVELWHLLRIGAHCQLSRKGFNTFGLSIGLTIGGRPKK